MRIRSCADCEKLLAVIRIANRRRDLEWRQSQTAAIELLIENLVVCVRPERQPHAAAVLNISFEFLDRAARKVGWICEQDTTKAIEVGGGKRTRIDDGGFEDRMPPAFIIRLACSQSCENKGRVA